MPLGSGSLASNATTGGEVQMPGSESPSSPPTTHLLPELLYLLTTAAQELDRHVRADGQKCQVCLVPWPCERARLAAFTLGAL